MHVRCKHIIGFMQTARAPCLPEWQYMLDSGNEATRDAISAYEALKNG